MTTIEVIKKRTSCRVYSDKGIDKDKREELREFLAAHTNSPFNSMIRFLLLDFSGLEALDLKAPGTYGVIKGAKYFIVGAVGNHAKAMEDYGYCMEKNILKATAMGLGTCWLGGTFSRSGFGERMGLVNGELLPAISPVGYSSSKRSIVDRLFRLSAGSDKRKPWDELFFAGNIRTPLQKDSSSPYEEPLECVRIGPSASNKQPWRIIKDRGNLHFYLSRTPGYNAVFGDIKMQNIDMGIAMCHFELSARELGLKGAWKVADPRVEAGDTEYIVSWIGNEL